MHVAVSLHAAAELTRRFLPPFPPFTACAPGSQDGYLPIPFQCNTGGMSRSGIPTLPPPYTHVQEGGSTREYRGPEEGLGGGVTLQGGAAARESWGTFDFDLAGGSASEYRGSEEGWGRDVTHWGAAAMASGGSWRHEFDLDVRDLGKEPVRISLAAVCVCE